MSISTNTVRVGKKYRLVNYSESYEFKVEDILNRDDFVARDLMTLETYRFSELIQFGKGKDYFLDELG